MSNSKPVDTFHMPDDARCPDCGYPHSGASHAMGGKPSRPVKGDLSICFNCGAINEFDGKGRVHPVNMNELLRTLPLDQRVKLTLAQASIIARGPLTPKDPK